MTNTISSFSQAVPSVAPVRPDAPADLAFLALLDAITVHNVPARPQFGTPEVLPVGPIAPPLAEDQIFADEDALVLNAEVVPQMAILGLPELLIVVPPAQPDLPQPASQPDLQIVESGLPSSDAKPLFRMSADDAPADQPVPDQPMDESPKTINAPSGPDLKLVNPHASSVVGPILAGTAQPLAATVDLSADALIKAVPQAQAQPAGSAPPNWPDQNTDLPQTQNAPTVAGAFLQLVKASPSSFASPLAVLAPSNAPIAERPVPAAIVKSAQINQPDRPALIPSVVQPALAAIVTRPTSDTALFGFQMRIQDMEQAAAVSAPEDVPKASPPLAPPQALSGAMRLVAARPPLEPVEDALAAIPEENGPANEIAGAVPLPELSARHATVVPPQRPDTAMPPTGLRNLPQTVALALRADPAQPVSLQLDPIELGTVAFNMDTGPAGLVVTIIAERPETLELLRRNADQFLADLRQSGFQGASLQFGQSGTSGQDQQRQDSAPPHASGPQPATAPLFETSASKPPPRASNGLDMRL